jgi:putative transposase
VRCRSCRPDDAAARARLRELASVRRRFGYRRLHILLAREGIAMNHKKLRHLYREERLQGASLDRASVIATSDAT